MHSDETRNSFIPNALYLKRLNEKFRSRSYQLQTRIYLPAIKANRIYNSSDKSSTNKLVDFIDLCAASLISVKTHVQSNQKKTFFTEQDHYVSTLLNEELKDNKSSRLSF